MVLAAITFVWGLEEEEADTHVELMLALLIHHVVAEMTPAVTSCHCGNVA